MAVSAGLSGVAGCSAVSGFIGDCPDDPITDTSIPTDRRSIEFLDSENWTVKSSKPPEIVFDHAHSRVVINGTFSGATPKSVHPKDMILVDRLRYDEQSDTLRVRLVERQCRSRGAGVGGESTPYVLDVQFPERLPKQVCVQERGGRDKDVCVSVGRVETTVSGHSIVTYLHSRLQTQTPPSRI